MTEKHYKNEVGTIINVDCGCDLTTATSTVFNIRKPSGIEVMWPAILEGTNFLRYISIEGDFSETGLYLLQADVSLPGWIGLGGTASFEIFEKYT